MQPTICCGFEALHDQLVIVTAVAALAATAASRAAAAVAFIEAVIFNVAADVVVDGNTLLVGGHFRIGTPKKVALHETFGRAR